MTNTNPPSLTDNPLPENHANAPGHYTQIALGVVVGLAGVFARFIGVWPYQDLVSNLCFVLGIIICVKSVLTILK